MKGFLQRILQEIMKKNNALNIRRLVNETVVPSTQCIILKIVGFIKCLESLQVCPKWSCKPMAPTNASLPGLPRNERQNSIMDIEGPSSFGTLLTQ